VSHEIDIDIIFPTHILFPFDFLYLIKKLRQEKFFLQFGIWLCWVHWHTFIFINETSQPKLVSNWTWLNMEVAIEKLWQLITLRW